MNDVEAVPSLPDAVRVTGATDHPAERHGQNPSESLGSSQVISTSAAKEDGQRAPDGLASRDEGASTKADSEAETIIDPDEPSPEKRKQDIQHKSDRNEEGREELDGTGVLLNSGKPRKRKRMENEPQEDGRVEGRIPSGQSSRLSSPSQEVRQRKTEDSRIMFATRGSSQSRTDELDSGKGNQSTKRWSSEGLRDGEGETHRLRDQHMSQVVHKKESEESNNVSYKRRISNDRSVSPGIRSNKIIPSHPSHPAGDPRRRRQLPPPLITDRRRHSSEDRQSISSSASGSPLPTPHLRKATSNEYTAASPAKQMQHKKRRDQNGRTRLARACAAQELEAAKARHAERPEDLNIPDNAGNTPLQIAALEGCAPIVKFLIEAGCEINTRNIDRDTPLIDAVENGHLEVVKLLLDAGANPRIGNAEGDEPYDLVPSDNDNYEELRKVIANAKANGLRRRKSDDQSGHGSSSVREPSSRGASAASPRDSPPIPGPRSPPATGLVGRRRTVRSEATRNDLLWTKATPENLRDFAAKGDMAGVANILNVLQKADTESLIAAAKGGHDEVLGILLGMGNPDPDPEPSGNHKPGFNTPMLAAIGRGNLAVIRLLLDQRGFDPTRRDRRNRTYYELSRERKGDHWVKEFELLKDAYNTHINKARKTRKPDIKSPKRSRDKEKDARRQARHASSSPGPQAQQKPFGSPGIQRHAESQGRETEPVKDKKKREGVTHAKEKLSLPSAGNHARPRHRDGNHSEPSAAVSDHDTTQGEPAKSRTPLSGRSHSDSIPSGNEKAKRRRLIAGRPPDRSKRRASLLSSDSLSGHEEPSKVRPERPSFESRSARQGGMSLKRSRSSVSPDAPRYHEREHKSGDPLDIQQKRRRIQSEEKESKLLNGKLKRDNDIPAQSSNAEPRRKGSNAPKLDRERSQATDIHLSKETTEAISPIKQEHHKRELGTMDDIPMEDVNHTEVEARAIQEKTLAAEAERARLEKEAKEAEEAKDAAEKAARLARERAEEEERKRKESEQRRLRQAEEERQKRREQERLRLARLRKEQEEQEQRRRDALPNRLRVAANLVGSNDPRASSHDWLKRFMPVVTATTRQIDAFCDIEVESERWIPNYLVAPLLGTNDLQLSQYTSWEKRMATPTQRNNLWRVTRRILVEADQADVLTSSYSDVMRRDMETRPKYFSMEYIFWVKLSDFMDLVPHKPHLQGLDIQLLRMHVDPEPSPGDPVEEPQKPNGIAHDHGSTETLAESPLANGFVTPNGLAHP